ncbi:PIN-like domain-containing protein [Micromonospora echinospora]|uniref:PIN-like domain-containing protein n=1 Tax=Micromonospora echinospora TaxID=1877 RepID=UPI003CF6A9F3
MTGEQAQFRRMFPGWLGPPGSVGDYFKDGLFVPDANILLGCYRIGPDAREQLLGTLERHRDRLWIPHQSALEFARNRRRVLPDQKKRHGDAKKLVNVSRDRAVAALSDAVKALTDYRTTYHAKNEWHAEQHGLAKDDINAKLSELLHPVTAEFTAIQNEHDLTDRDFADETQDPILARLSALLDGKVGPRYDSARIRQIVQETVEFRFPNKMPPGYKDAAEKDTELGAAGDVILWYQILDRLRTGEDGFRKVVWITTDVKEDLWVLDRDRRAQRARPELVQEMHDETGAELLMVTLHDFLAGAKDHLNEDISNETLKQAEDLAIAPPENIGQLTWQLLQQASQSRESYHAENLAYFVANRFTDAGHTVVDFEVRKAGADMVLHRGDQTTVVAVRTSERDVNTALTGLHVAADALAATSKIMIYTGSYTPLQLKRGTDTGIEMRDFTDLLDLIQGPVDNAP